MATSANIIPLVCNHRYYLGYHRDSRPTPFHFRWQITERNQQSRFNIRPQSPDGTHKTLFFFLPCIVTCGFLVSFIYY